jgi:ribosomal protein L16 Arg81 hydroxylase
MNIQDAISPEELEKIREIFWGTHSHKIKCLCDITSSLPSISELILLLNGGYKDNEWHSGKVVNMNVSRINTDGTIENMTDIPISDAEKYFNRGYTLCFNDVSQFTSELKALRDSSISYFGGGNKVLITCYLTPPKSSGVLHYDRQHNFFLQSEGNKIWTVSDRPAVESPFDNLVYPGATKEFFDIMEQQDYQILKPFQCGKVKYELYPNDILYIPPGFYHVAETEEQTSLHYTLTFEPLSFWSEINPQIFKMLISNCTNMNKDIRMLSPEAAKQHFEECMLEFKSSLSDELLEDLIKDHSWKFKD